MDKKKSILIIILALIMALVVALMIQTKHTTPLEIKDSQKEKTIFDSSTSVNEEDIKKEIFKTVNEEKKVEEKASANKQENKSTAKATFTTNLDTPTFERLEVKEEINKVEEAGVSFDDPGIINDNGVIVVTRDFKLKSPRKYSFKDFGVLAEPPVR